MKILVLKQDVENKQADKRAKYDPWLAPQFKAGSKFVSYQTEMMGYEITVIRPIAKGRSLSWGQAEDRGLYPEMFHEKEVQTWEEISALEGGFDHLAGLVINKMLRMDYVDVNDVRDVLKAVLDSEDE